MVTRRGYGQAVAQKLFQTDYASLKEAREAAAGCRACPLWELGTQTVFGEGSPKSELMLVGEQPGDQEDLAGKPFVGPAGRLLDKALEEAGIDRKLAYVTNVVKHFKWQPRGKRRIHQKPNAAELAPVVMATVHPSSILRSENREEELGLFVEDLRRVAEALRAA